MDIFSAYPWCGSVSRGPQRLRTASPSGPTWLEKHFVYFYIGLRTSKFRKVISFRQYCCFSGTRFDFTASSLKFCAACKEARLITNVIDTEPAGNLSPLTTGQSMNMRY